jgi:hypothetical protein
MGKYLTKREVLRFTGNAMSVPVIGGVLAHIIHCINTVGALDPHRPVSFPVFIEDEEDSESHLYFKKPKVS